MTNNKIAFLFMIKYTCLDLGIALKVAFAYTSSAIKTSKNIQNISIKVMLDYIFTACLFYIIYNIFLFICILYLYIFFNQHTIILYVGWAIVGHLVM